MSAKHFGNCSPRSATQPNVYHSCLQRSLHHLLQTGRQVWWPGVQGNKKQEELVQVVTLGPLLPLPLPRGLPPSYSPLGWLCWPGNGWWGAVEQRG